MRSRRAQHGHRLLGFALSALCLAGCRSEESDERSRSLAHLQDYLSVARAPSIHESMFSRLYWRLRDDAPIDGANSNWLAGARYDAERDLLVAYGLLFRGEPDGVAIIAHDGFGQDRREIYRLRSPDLVESIRRQTAAREGDTAFFRVYLFAPVYGELIEAIRRSRDDELWLEISFRRVDGDTERTRCPIIFYREGRVLDHVSNGLGADMVVHEGVDLAP